MKRAGLVWFLVLLMQAASAHLPIISTPIVVPPGLNGELFLWRHVYQYTDPKGQLDIRQIIDQQRNGKFRPSPSETVRQDFGYNTTAAHWLFFELESPANSPAGRSIAGRRLMLEIEYANLDDLELRAQRRHHSVAGAHGRPLSVPAQALP